MEKIGYLLIIAFIIYSCNQKNAEVKSDLEAANLKGNIWKIEKTIFDANPRCACAAAMKDESNKTLYVYDKKGNLTRSYAFDEEGDTSQSSIYSYNRRGLCQQVEKYNGEALVGKEMAEFQGTKLTASRVFDKYGNNEITMNFIYNGEEISEEKTIDVNGRLIKTMENEFLNGQLVSQTEKDSIGEIKSIRKYKRNSSGDLTEFLIIVPKDSAEYKLTYEYEYDSTGNWVKQTRFYDNEVEYIIVRNIEYFDI